jgi:hypothetical protein
MCLNATLFVKFMLLAGLEPVGDSEYGLILLRSNDSYVTTTCFEYTPEVYCYLENWKENEA